MRHLIPVGAATISALGAAMWATPSMAPVDRLEQNLRAVVEDEPDNANAHYLLGRVHGLAFLMKSREIAVWNHRTQVVAPLPDVAQDSFQRSPFNPDPDEIPDAGEQMRHLRESIVHGRRAIELDDRPARHHLSIAYVCEVGMVHADEVDVLPGEVSEPDASTRAEAEALIDELADSGRAMKLLRASLERYIVVIHEHRDDERDEVREAVRSLLTEYWRECAIASYLDAYTRAPADFDVSSRPDRMGLAELAGYEAARGYERLVVARGVRDEERDHLAHVRADIERLEALSHARLMTPIIFSMEESRPLEDLLSGSSVIFDLDGDGRRERWPWVRPDTAILVWDPAGEGSVLSGRQLFGSVTWWMFFDDGYAALDALDDDRNGELAGDELRGLAIWVDADHDGVSDAGEVTPIERTPIAGIRTEGASMVGLSPWNAEGLRLDDGTILPTYDWVTAPEGR